MDAFSLPAAAGLPAAAVDTSLREALRACDRARECAVLWFAEVQRREPYRGLGFASLEIYAVEGLGFSRNRYWQFKRLADDLDRLPALREAVADGGLGWTRAQQVARVATPATASAWVAKAATIGRRELAGEVRHVRRRNSGPTGAAGEELFGGTGSARGSTSLPASPLPATITLRGDGLQVARFEALLEKAHKLGLVARGADRFDTILVALEALVESAGNTGHPRAHARAAKSGPATCIVIHQCPDCGAAAAVTQQGEVPLAPAHVAAAACDARVERPGRANRATIPPKVRAAVLARDRHRCAAAGCASARFLEVHHVVPRAQGGSNRAANLVTLCGRCHRFAHEHAGGVAPAPPGLPPAREAGLNRQTAGSTGQLAGPTKQVIASTA